MKIVKYKKNQMILFNFRAKNNNNNKIKEGAFNLLEEQRCKEAQRRVKVK
jgi:hypothetical protein